MLSVDRAPVVVVGQQQTRTLFGRATTEFFLTMHFLSRRFRHNLSVVLATLMFGAILASATAISPPPAAADEQQSFSFDGGGWGHGVGMSQFGAFGRAAAGQGSTEILQAYYQGIGIEQRDVTNNIKVQLSISSATTLQFGKKARIKLDGNLIAEVAAWQEIAVTRLADRWAIIAAGVDICAPQPVPEGAEPVPSPCIGWQLRFGVKDLVEQQLSTSDHSYRHGRLELTPNGNGASDFHVVLGQLTMDEYLYGLAEMPSSWPAEALKAQAIAGRSYAESRITTRRNASWWHNPFDLYSSTLDQAFTGSSKELGAFSENWRAAVDQTHGTVATHSGAVIDALYSSSHGGHSENSEYVFSATVPYLRGVPDPFDSHENPLHSWSRTYSAADLSRWLAQSADTNVGTLRNLSIDGNIGVSGRVNRATITLEGSDATKSVSGGRFRIVVNRGLASDGRFNRSDQLLSTNYSYRGPTDQAPIGKFKRVKLKPNRIVVSGWAMDLDISGPSKVKVTVDGERAKTRKAKRRKPALEPTYGNGINHGFRIKVKASPGTHEVCVIALNNVRRNTRTHLGCRTVEVPAPVASPDPGQPPAGDIPVGTVEVVRVTSGNSALRVAGWALDPKSSDSIKVAFDIDQKEVASTTARFEHDGLDSYGKGSAHGFDVTLPVSRGEHQLCVRAFSSDRKVAVVLGCQQIVV
ncbi:MAG: SpoIID/LytB domain-containing protein [Acidimicrobiales bacterium]